jgi:hypothetical protein
MFIPRRLFASVAGSCVAQLISLVARSPNIEFGGTWSRPTSVALMIAVLPTWAFASYAMSGAPE